MKGLKQFWKKLKYWQKGGMIGALLFLIYGILVFFYTRSDVSSFVLGGDFAFGILMLPATLLSGIFLHLGIISDTPSIMAYLAVYFSALIEGFLVGALIGLIIGKVKKK